MKPRWPRSTFALVAGLTLATLLPSWAPAAAASMFGPAGTAAPNCTREGRDHVAGTPQATVVNDGRGIARSGAARSAGLGVICMQLNSSSSPTGSIEFSGPASRVTSAVAVNRFHKAYPVRPGTLEDAGFNEQTVGVGPRLPAPDMSLERPGPSASSVRAFTREVATASSSK